MTPEGRRAYFADPASFPVFFAYYFPEYIKYPFADFHFTMFSDIGRLLLGAIRELAWIMFRESAKTSIAKALIVYLIATKKRRYINVDSFDKSNAEVLFDVANALMTDKGLIQDFGQLFSRTKNQNEMTLQRIGKFLTRNSVMVEAHSTGESNRGGNGGGGNNISKLADKVEKGGELPTDPALAEKVQKEIARRAQERA